MHCPGQNFTIWSANIQLLDMIIMFTVLNDKFLLSITCHSCHNNSSSRASSGRRNGGSCLRARHQIVVCARPLLPVGAVWVLPATAAAASAASLGGTPSTSATAAVAEAGCTRLVPAAPSAYNNHYHAMLSKNCHHPTTTAWDNVPQDHRITAAQRKAGRSHLTVRCVSSFL